MGQVSTEQTAIIIDSVAKVVEASKMHAEPNMNFWWLLSLGVIPVVLGWWLNKKRKKNGK